MISTIPTRPKAVAPPAVRCAIAAFGLAETTAANMANLRQTLAAAWAGTLSAPQFRQADEQTLLGLAAVAQARALPSLAGVDFAAWGVLAAPRYFARAALVASLERTRVDGPWGVSPQFVAHRSLHSLPGMLSIGLKSRGPNLGVGGGPGAESEVLLTAAAFLHADGLPGVWVVMTAWQPEPIPTPQGQVPPDSVCRAVALALTPANPSADFQMRILCRPAERSVGESIHRTQGEGFRLESLHTALATLPDYPATWLWQLEHGVVELHWPGRAEGRQS